MTHPNGGNSKWTQDREDILKKLYLEGHSASVIAARISATGFPVTRNAVIGKAHRLCLNGQAPVKRARSGNSFVRKTKRSLPPKVKPWLGTDLRKSAKLFLSAEPFVPGPELVIPLDERKTIATLEENDCRWPIGDPQHADFHFCGRSKVPGLVYCQHHAMRAYQPPENKRGWERRGKYVKGMDMTVAVDALMSGDAPINTREKADA